MRLSTRVVVVSGMLFAPTAFAQNAGKAGSGGTAATPPAAAPAPAAGKATPAPSAAPAPAPAATPPATPATPAPAPAPAAPPAPAPSAPAPAAAPAAPAPLSPTTTPGAAPANTVDLGLSPTTPAIGGGTAISAKQAESLTATTSGGADEWKFDFHGYLRAPLHISFGPPSPAQLPSTFNPSTNVPPGYATESAPPGQLRQPLPAGRERPSGDPVAQPHPRPGLPLHDLGVHQHRPGPWAQLNFSYGNSRAMATVIVDSYSQTDGGYKQSAGPAGDRPGVPHPQLPRRLRRSRRADLNIGTFQNRYGTMGKYDGGMYETYIFGRTHVTGVTLTANLRRRHRGRTGRSASKTASAPRYDLVPYLNNPYYQVLSNDPVGYNNGKPYLADRDAEYLPYAGPVPQGSTFVHHAHIGAKYQKLWTFGLHYIYTWTPDDNWNPIETRVRQPSRTTSRGTNDGPDPGEHGDHRRRGPLRGGVTAMATSPGRTSTRADINALADASRSSTPTAAISSSRTSSARRTTPTPASTAAPRTRIGNRRQPRPAVLLQLRCARPLPGGLLGRGPDLV